MLGTTGFDDDEDASEHHRGCLGAKFYGQFHQHFTHAFFI